jgi:hypothetical protein
MARGTNDNTNLSKASKYSDFEYIYNVFGPRSGFVKEISSFFGLPWDQLWNQTYLSDELKAELRKQALAEGLLRGGSASDYEATPSDRGNSKIYK